MKKLFCLLACFFEFSLMADPVCSQPCKMAPVLLVDKTEEKTDFDKSFCSITLIEKSLICLAYQEREHLTPVLDRQHPTPDFFRLILPSNDMHNAEDHPTPVLNANLTSNLFEEFE